MAGKLEQAGLGLGGSSMNPGRFTTGFVVKYTGVGKKIRKVQCGICNQDSPLSIVPHMRDLHPKEWEQWKDDWMEQRRSGKSYKHIMKDFVGEDESGDDRLLFSWTVIKSEVGHEDPMLLNPSKITSLQPSKKEFTPDPTTLWLFDKRGSWGTHTPHYPGNFAPEVARNLIIRFSKPGDHIVDCFVGGGTSLIEARLLGRHALGIDIGRNAVEASTRRLNELEAGIRDVLTPHPKSTVVARHGDARKMDFIADSSIDLVIAHPPYMNVISYSKDPEDLSEISILGLFLSEMEKVAREIRRILKRKQFCAIVIGDIRRERKIVPLGIGVFNTFTKVGFHPEEIIIKGQSKMSRNEFFFQKKGEDLPYLQIGHEYVFVFQR